MGDPKTSQISHNSLSQLKQKWHTLPLERDLGDEGSKNLRNNSRTGKKSEEQQVERIELKRNLQTHSLVWSRDLQRIMKKEQEQEGCTRSSSSPLRNLQRF
jgi:hypothetical protein